MDIMVDKMLIIVWYVIDSMGYTIDIIHRH
jgi:hypothetical protein